MTTDLFGLMNADNPNGPHWQGARAGQILVQRCEHCLTLRFPATPLCASCASKTSTWVEIGTTGRIVAWCRFHRAYFPEFKDKLPYIVILVELEAGIRLYANLATEDPLTQPPIGATVTAAFEPLNDQVGLIKFRL